MKTKKIVSILLTLCMLLSAIPLSAFIASAESEWLPVTFVDDEKNVTSTSTCEYQISSEGTMTIRPKDNASTGELPSAPDSSDLNSIYWCWNAYLNDMTDVKNVVFQNGVKSGDTLYGLFESFEYLESVDFSGLDTSNAKSMNSLLAFCYALSSVTFGENFDTSNVTDMAYMFYYCGMTSVDLSGFDTSNVTDMSGMFMGSSATTINFSGIDTSNVTNMRFMFEECPDLKELDVSDFDTSNVENMESMFQGCTSLEELDLSNFNTSKVTTMKKMFQNCSALKELDISGFITTEVTDMSNMFYNCATLEELDLTSFNPSKVTQIADMFDSCALLKTIYASSNWNGGSYRESTEVFVGCLQLAGGAGMYYNQNYTQAMYARIDSAENEGYFTQKAAKPTYAVTVGECENGSISVGGASSYAQGVKIKVNVAPAEGYELDKVYINSVAIEGTSFVMPAAAANVTATFKKIEPATVTGYVPVYAYWEDNSADIPENAEFEFKIEAVTAGAPLPANTTMSIAAPTQKGEANKVGYSSSDTSNPWAITFTNNGTYKYKVTQTTTKTNSFNCDEHEFFVFAVVKKAETPAVEFLTQQTEDVVLKTTDFQYYLGNSADSADTKMETNVYGDVTSITLGGAENVATGTKHNFNIGVAQSTYSFNFKKDFTINGSMNIAVVPDGTFFGFIPTAYTPSGVSLNSGGCIGVYYVNHFDNGLFVEFDTYDNDTNVADSVAPGEPVPGISNAHIDVVKTANYGTPTQLARLADVGHVSNMANYTSLSVVNDASENELTVTINGNLSYTYKYSDSEFEEAYFVFGGCERFDAEEEAGLTSNNLTSGVAAITTISISSIEFYEDLKSENAGIEFCNTPNTKYSVTTGSVTNGTITLDASEYYPGDTVTVTATSTKLNYCLDKIYVNGEEITGTTFTMPASAVTVTATFKKNDGYWEDGETPANNQIFYTATSKINNIAFMSAAFGGITSTYDETTQKGILTFGSEITSIPDDAFCEKSLTSIILPSSVKSLGYGAFEMCGTLTSVSMPGVETVGFSAFTECSNLTTVYMPNATTIKEYAFEDCDSLKYVYASSSATGSLSSYGLYSIATGNATNGTFTVNEVETGEDYATYVKNGTELTVTATPEDGYRLDKVSVNGSSVSGTTFNMPSSAATVTATFKELKKDTITLGGFNKTTGKFEYATATDNNVYKYVTITLAANVEGEESITLPSVDGYAVVNKLSTEYSKTIALSEEKTAKEIIEDYFSQVQFSGCESQHVSVILNTEAPKGKVAYNAANGHYYMYAEFGENNDLDWVDSYNDAKNTYFMGRQGYLATITSKDEDLFIYKVCGDAVGWLGATNLKPGTQSGQYYEFTGINSYDSEDYNDKWIWACGPEAGVTLFDVATLSDYWYDEDEANEIYARNYNNTYHNWGTEFYEPNNYNESCLTTLPFGFGYATSDDLPDNDGYGTYSWNNVEYDRTILDGGSKESENDEYAPAGYVIEFGNQPIGNDAEENSLDYVSAVSDFAGDYEITNSNPKANEAENNGYLEVSVSQAGHGDKVVVTATPKAGYYVSKVYYQIGSGEKQEIEYSEIGYAFEMPEGNVTVSADFGEIPAAVKNAHYYASLTLYDNIDINFVMKKEELGEGFDISNLKIYVDGVETATAPVLKNGDVFCVLKAISPEQIGDTVNVRVEYEGITVKDFEYSVSKYCNAVRSQYSSYDENTRQGKLVILCNAVLNYGKYAKDYANEEEYGEGNYEASTLNSGITFTPAEIARKSSGATTSSNITAASASLSLNSTISLNFFVNSKIDLDETKVHVYNNYDQEVGTVTVTKVENDEKYNYKITVSDLYAMQMSRYYTLKVDGDSSFILTYGVYDYCSDAQGNEDFSSTLQNLCNATYQYGQAAIDYDNAKKS